MAVSGETSDLLVDVVIAFGYVERAANTNRGVIQMSRPDLGDVARTVHLLILGPVLIVVICLPDVYFLG